MKRRRLGFLLLLTGCGTLASPAGGDQELPNAHAGPFRLLRSSELDSTITSYLAPYVARNERQHYRSPAPLDIDGDASTLPIWLYAVAGPGNDSRIVRFFAHDGRSLDRVPEVVLEASEDWEGGRVSSPSALRVAEEVWLYYAGADGIGVAKSHDGRVFVKERAPILTGLLGCGGSSSDKAPTDVSVLRLPDGSFRLFFSTGEAICEAASMDGLVFGFEGAVLRASHGAGEFDSASLSHPFALTTTSPEGRLIVRVYYTGWDEKGATAIGMAARYGSGGPLVRALSPVLATDLGARDPAVLPFAGFTLLYFSAHTDPKSPALAAAVAPANLDLEARPLRHP